MITFGDRMSTRMVNDIARHDIPLSDPVALRRELYGLVTDDPNVRWLACGNEAGGMTDAGRLADGTLVFLMTDDFRAGVYREYEASPDGRMGNLRKSGVYFVAGPIAVLDDATEPLPNLLQIRRSGAQPAQSRMGVSDRRCDGLIDFMGDRSRQLPHRRNAVRMCQLHLYLAQGFSGALTLGDILAHDQDDGSLL